MLFDVAFDLVLDQVRADRVQHGAEHDVLDVRGAGGVHNGYADRPLARVDGRADVVDLLRTSDGAGHHRGVAEVPDDHLVNTPRA